MFFDSSADGRIERRELAMALKSGTRVFGRRSSRTLADQLFDQVGAAVVWWRGHTGMLESTGGRLVGGKSSGASMVGCAGAPAGVPCPHLACC